LVWYLLPALGNDQGHVVGLLVGAERFHITNDRSHQNWRSLLTMPPQRFDKALLSELLTCSEEGRPSSRL